ncbi:MAG: GGDEF domain-containing protein, partial [Oricola sp.]|nr:GGDEF domain-containing protein [Oricola sp.]
MDGIAIFSAFLQGLGIVAFAGRLHELAITRCTSPRWETAATALTFAVAAAVSMTFPLRFAPGIIFDLRHVFLILAGPFGGLPAALLTAAATGGLRFLEGGVGLYPGLAGIAISTTIGLGFAWLNGNRDYTLAKVSLLGLLSEVSITSLFVLPLPIALELLGRISIPIIIVNFVGVLIAAESLNRFRVQMHREESLARDSSTDPLTGLSNRRAFDVQGPELA